MLSLDFCGGSHFMNYMNFARKYVHGIVHNTLKPLIAMIGLSTFIITNVQPGDHL